MTVYVDPPHWTKHGRRWSHLVADSLEELHAFAADQGLPRRAFHGDHYDVPEEYLDELLAAGAVAVTSRELLAVLRRSGTRLSPAERRRRAGS